MEFIPKFIYNNLRRGGFGLKRWCYYFGSKWSNKTLKMI